MNRKQILSVVKWLQQSQISLNECYNRCNMDKIDWIINPLFVSMKDLIWKHLWDWITRRVYECPYFLSDEWFAKCEADWVKYELETIDDFLDFLIIQEYIVE